MKGLLHSKVFKRNLRKWLFMYVGVMCLLATVVTYSKYISSLLVSDNGRAARFNVDIQYKDAGNCIIGETCLIAGKFRPTSSLNYNFHIKTDLEVKTVFVVSIYVHDDFDIKSLTVGNKKMSLDELKSNSKYNVSTICTKTDENGCIEQTKMITITDTVLPNNNINSDYQIEVQYTKNDKDYQSISGQELEVVKIGYSAIQADKGE